MYTQYALSSTCFISIKRLNTQMRDLVTGYRPVGHSNNLWQEVVLTDVWRRNDVTTDVLIIFVSFVYIIYYTQFEILLVCTNSSTVMSKFYLSGAAKRKARQERETKAAKMPKISKFLKSADSAPENTLDLVI